MAIDARAALGGLLALGGRERALLRRSILRDAHDPDPIVAGIIAGLLPVDASDAEVRAVALVGALINQPGANLTPQGGRCIGRAWGRHVANVRRVQGERRAVEATRRFDALIDADADSVPRHLTYIAAILRQERIAFGWTRLLADLCRWEEGGRAVQRVWVARFVRLAGAGRSA